MPPFVICGGERFEHVETFKHDFFAATGLYRGAGGRLAVLKLGRQSDLASIPMRWLGRFLTGRESAIYTLLSDTPGVPRLIGTIQDGTGFLHEFVPGHALERDERVGDSFFDELFGLLRRLHDMHIAYVDLNKRQNVLVGDDGRPYLIDFQISLHLPPVGWRGIGPLRWLLARFQQADWYHAHKHKRRLRPDLLTPAERALVENLSVWIRLHRLVARPLTNLRRKLLRRLLRTERADVAGASAK